ncbi:MAG: FKBP-type peptidyl-prolyl cis-trans isomerase [Gammaproteobacteria bacterium]|nr:FKBP-type peptidyl-prolyl cis-trans isomerase [Gammaproteobacteria bacterium]NNF49403.1 FKBP-type peptidyl-prolyl cis-trans isomerase [Woeseiaceae bacterium]MBT8093524.1 FKBP-type peptidyl-prolyl cis-trans isomerase [Gammaproteobacteria bacterium]MBT8106512.1 FKBP-type peptidyl-prolyl cis-trans isomerase [Gammaproteobacteria bacterium]NNK26527.1 FKBP-type peptidyl-prolyl cis-trans isomerase [Woeseiaceae bacterium]
MKISKLFLAVAAVTLVSACGPADEPPAESDAVQDAVANCPKPDANGVVEIEDGLVATIVKRGYGRAAQSRDYADVHTTLWLYDEAAEGGRGTEIWTSGGAQPFQFQIDAGQVIAGWDLGVKCMLIGETRELRIAPELGYGERGKPPVPPNATLLFEVELVRLVSPDET